MGRYDKKPLLRLLECYVLDAIGELTAEHRTALEEMQPLLIKAFGKAGTWDQVIAARMELPPALPSQIKELWHKNLARIGRVKGATLDPEDFARLFVDENFPLQE